MSASLLEKVVAGQAPDLFPLTVKRFHRMIETGILPEGTPVELIEGMAVWKDRRCGEERVVHGPRHAFVVTNLARLDRLVEPLGCHVRSQLPVTLSEHDEPEPDAAIVSGAPTTFAARHPRGEDVLVVIEVADSSAEYDRTTKQRLYARAGIPRYLIVNLPGDKITAYDTPLRAEGRYEHSTEFGHGQSVRLVLGKAALDLAASDVLPPLPEHDKR